MPKSRLLSIFRKTRLKLVGKLQHIRLEKVKASAVCGTQSARSMKGIPKDIVESIKTVNNKRAKEGLENKRALFPIRGALVEIEIHSPTEVKKETTTEEEANYSTLQKLP